ncbi:MAG: hypothetical protein AUH86_04520 [Acidobacteria bacterium 13_1_40CM_4_58_4]|nr:MAG: hypothetical protein AUH86_04520 [Acidobacteria bacterium 13_1_40CM_4_58_4]
MRHGEAFRALAHQHDVAGVVHNSFGHKGNVLDVAHSADSASAPRWSVHTTGVELNHAFFVGQATEADAIVIGIIFRPFHDSQRCIEGVAAVFEETVSVIEVVVAIVGRDDNRPVARRGLCFVLLRDLLFFLGGPRLLIIQSE